MGLVVKTECARLTPTKMERLPHGANATMGLQVTGVKKVLLPWVVEGVVEGGEDGRKWRSKGTLSAFIWFSGKYKFVFFWKSFYFFGKICIILEKFLLFWKNLYFFGKVFIFLEKFVLPENQMNALNVVVVVNVCPPLQIL